MRRKVILDTDIGFMNDDCTACLFALHSPALEVLGICPVAGNFPLVQETEDALRILELVGRTEVPVCAGCDRPLVHERDEYADRTWGGWGKAEPAIARHGQFARLRPDPRHAVDFIIEQVRRYPRAVTLIAIGPLTNVALAFRKAPDIVPLVEEVVIMGGWDPLESTCRHASLSIL